MPARHTEQRPDPAPATESPRPSGLEAPHPPSADPNQKTEFTFDPQADDPGNGAD